jgi:hypothetical protein
LPYLILDQELDTLNGGGSGFLAEMISFNVRAMDIGQPYRDGGRDTTHQEINDETYPYR